jgi:hypothetical protein
MKRLLFIGITALMLTACTKDVIIRGDSGVVNVGEVTAEQAVVKVTGKAHGKSYELGTYPIADVADTLGASWADVEGTAMLERDMGFKLETTVTYIGTKNTVEVLVDTTKVVCPKGFMFITCMSQLTATQDGLVLLYKEKFSYLK